MAKKQDLNNEDEIRLADLKAKLEKSWGKGSFCRYGDMEKITVDSIPTGIKTLDYILGSGGIPKGRITEIYGPESSSKTSLAAVICAQAQKFGGKVAYIDTENAVNVEYFGQLGVNVDDMFFAQPNSGEEAFDIISKAVESQVFSVIVLDSAATLPTKAELEGDIGDTHIALQARLMSQALRKLTAMINNANVALVIINQTRQNINTSGYGGSGVVTTGGTALKFYASLRLELRRTEYIKKGDDVIGQRVKIKTVKNKMTSPFKVVDLEFIFGKGYSTEGMIIDLAMDSGLLTRAGAWFSYKGERIGMGKESVREYLKSNPEFAEKIEKEVDEFIKTGKISITERTGDEDV